MKINKLFHGFSGRGAIVCSLLALMFLGGHRAGACPDIPDIISLPGSTFIEEKISVERSSGKKGIGGHTVHFGDTALTHNGECWHSITHRKCLSKMIKIRGYYRIVITKGSAKVGLLEFNDSARTFEVYSLNSSGQKAPDKPYLAFHDTIKYIRQEPALLSSSESGSSSRRVDMRPEYRIKALAYDRGRVVGMYESVSFPGGQVSRGIGAALAKKTGPSGAISLRGRNVSARNCHVDVRRM